MAKRIAELPEIVTITDQGVLVVVDDLAGTPTTKQLTISQLGDVFVSRTRANAPDGYPQVGSDGAILVPLIPSAGISTELSLGTNELGVETDTERLRVGGRRYDLYHLGGAHSLLKKPTDGALFACTLGSGSLGPYATVTAGDVAASWWDGTRTIADGGTFTKAVTDNRLKLFSVYPATSGESLTVLNVTNIETVAADVSGLSSLTDLVLGYNSLTELHLADLPVCWYVEVGDNPLTVLTLSNLPSLAWLVCRNSNLTYLDLRPFPAMSELDCSNASLSVLLLSDLTNLAYVGCNDNQLLSLDLSGCTGLLIVDCRNNQLESIRLPDVTASFEWCNASNNALGAAAINQLFEDLDTAPHPYAYVDVSDNPGVLEAGYDPTIATAKGYIVVDGS